MLFVRRNLTADEVFQTPSKGFHQRGQECFTLGLPALRFIETELRCGTSLETGMGVSTLLFAMHSSHHFAIGPESTERTAIEMFARDQHVDLSPVQFIIGESQRVLPFIQPDPLDIVLIDGDHCFPMPFIDWYYTSAMLKVGGYLMIDDVQIHTGSTLADFLSLEANWEKVIEWPEGDIPVRTVVFRKTKESTTTWWGEQPWTRR